MSVPIWARKGAKVVCINADDILTPSGVVYNPQGELHVGLTYTVRRVVPNDPSGWTCVELKEVRAGWFRRDAFLLCRFRPLVNGDNEIETVLYRQRKGKQSHGALRKKSVDA